MPDLAAQDPTRNAEYCRPKRTGHSVPCEQLQAGARSTNDRIPLARDHRPDPLERRADALAVLAGTVRRVFIR